MHSDLLRGKELAEHHAMEGGVGRVLRREDGSDMTTDSQRTILRRVALYAPGCRPTACSTRCGTASARG